MYQNVDWDKVKTLAGELAAGFETVKDRAGNELVRDRVTVRTLRDGVRERFQSLCHDAHGDMLPDDWRYSMIEKRRVYGDLLHGVDSRVSGGGRIHQERAREHGRGSRGGSVSGYQPKTGAACTCRPGAERDNCPRCEGTGQVIDFRAIRARVNAPLGRTPEKMGRCECKNGDCGGCLQSQEAVSDYDFDCTRDAVRLVTVPCASAINEERGTVTVRFTDVPFCAPCAAFHEQRRASHAAERGAK